jgi:hypothetical protein
MRTRAIDSVIAKGLSIERLGKYLVGAGSDLDKALALYERNTRLSESFYTPLQSMEICFRNRLHDELSTTYGADWYSNGAAPLDPDALQTIQSAVRDLGKAKKPLSPGAVVAELNFGFWVSLLGPRYDATIWRTALFRAFTENGGRMKRTRVHGRFNAMRRFRNRIAHHEPIFLNDLQARHAEIIEATSWMCPQTAAWALYNSRFPATFAAP